MQGSGVQCAEFVGIARIGRLVDVNDRIIAIADPIVDEIGANKAGSACHQNRHKPLLAALLRFQRRLNPKPGGHT